MKRLSESQYNLIKSYLPVQRGNVKISNLTLIHAVLYVAENGCKWRALPRNLEIGTRFIRALDAGLSVVFWNVCLWGFKRKI